MDNDKAADLFKAMAKKAGFTDESVALALSQPEWKEIENRDNRRSEYSRALDKARDLEPLANKAKEWDEWWTKKGGSQLYQTQTQQAQVLARYQERFGDLDPNNPSDVRRGSAESGLSMQQVQAMLDARLQEQGQKFSQWQSERDLVFADAANRGLKLTTDDVTAMNKMQSEKGVTYAAAYEQHMGPRVREMEQQRQTKEKEDYAAEKVRDALSRAGHNGVPTSAYEAPGFFDRPTNGVAEKSLSDQELLSMWSDAAPGNKSRAA